MGLNNLQEIAKMDKGNVLGSIGMFTEQCAQAWEASKKLIIPKNYSQVKNIIIVGMGGSGFAPEIVKFVFADKLRVPVEIINDYNLPTYAQSDSLVFLSSYSGTTHEVLNVANQSLKKHLKMVAICRGGELASFLKQNHIPGLIFEEKFNPSGQPRLGSGYMVMGIAGILKQCGLLSITDQEVDSAIDFVKKKQKQWMANALMAKNPAKKTAAILKGKIPLVVVAEFLEGNAHCLRNQFNESAKNFSGYHIIPELNHHLLEGLQYPKTNQENLIFLFINSNLYFPENQKRFEITKDVVEKNSIQTLELTLEGKTRLTQSLELFSLGSYSSFYLSFLNGVDAQKIPWVDYFKEKLAAHGK